MAGINGRPVDENQWAMTEEERHDWLRRNTDWSPDLPAAERQAIEEKFHPDAITLAPANRFN